MIIKPIRMLVKAFLVNPSPRRMAAGIALGVAVGLVPKGNLIAMGMMTAMCCLNINIVAGLLTIFLVSLVGYQADALFHEVGKAVLTAERLQPTWVWLTSQPIAAWTDFNNTVVMGSFVCGLAAILPAYWLALPVCRRVLPMVSERIQRWKITRWLTGASIMSRVTAASS